MRESLMYGSVRGTRGNTRPYRDKLLLQRTSPVVAHSVALNPFCQGLLIEGEAEANAAVR
jgi:hypothetical protein